MPETSISEHLRFVHALWGRHGGAARARVHHRLRPRARRAEVRARAGRPPRERERQRRLRGALRASGARIGLFGAIVGVFLGEIVAGADGLGQVMALGYRTLDTPAMYVFIITVSLAGFVLDRLFLLARRRLLAWSPEE